jgi:predicted GIY-YIG superfamily endonuclease
MTDQWICYLIKSTDSNKTYIGATNNLLRRLNDHCGLNGNSKGAKYTKGEMWYVILFISGFQNKQECLSFEYQFKKIKYSNIDLSSFNLFSSSGDRVYKRIGDLYRLILRNKVNHKWDKNLITVHILEKDYINPIKLIQDLSIKSC